MPAHTHLELIPLGGLGEFGMNCMVLRWGDEAILVDAGMMFPGEEHLGVDVVIPDLGFLDDIGTLHGVVLSHGHEDHIGALPYLLARRQVPVYATRYTRELVRARRSRRGDERRIELHDLPAPGEAFELGPFSIDTLPVAHSIPDCRMIVVETPVGVVLHTADFKLDPDPPDGHGTDLKALSRLGDRGVLALLSDSTNADVPGWTPGERTVRPALDAQIAGCAGRVFVTTFASNVQRVQQVIDAAWADGRRVALVGSSLETHGDIAQQLGFLRFPAGCRVAADEVMGLPPQRVVVVTTGTQGEPLSALSRISLGRHRDVAIEEGDRVLHSARRIPGNEKSIGRLFNHLLRRGAEVVTAADAPIHVSGHPAQDELRRLLELVRPRFVVPVHGEYGQLLAHARLAMAAGWPRERVLLADSGDVIAVGSATIEIVDRVLVGQVFIDAELDRVDREVLRDRRRVAGDGVVVAVVAMARNTPSGSSVAEIVTRGFVPEFEGGDRLLEDARRVVLESVDGADPEERGDESLMKARILADLKRFLRRETQRRPLIVPVILEL